MVIFGIILLLAILSRFYDLGARVISHDETSHVYYAWRLFQGMGYSHDPITHGPFQFHFLALIYFLLGDSDFTARIPAAITSVLTILFVWKYRRYLGKWGTLAAALMFLISPFMLYYGRYVRNEAFVALFGVVTLWAILRYLETSQPKYPLLVDRGDRAALHDQRDLLHLYSPGHDLPRPGLYSGYFKGGMGKTLPKEAFPGRHYRGRFFPGDQPGGWKIYP